jgi:hypothetical protein
MEGQRTTGDMRKLAHRPAQRVTGEMTPNQRVIHEKQGIFPGRPLEMFCQNQRSNIINIDISPYDKVINSDSW